MKPQNDKGVQFYIPKSKAYKKYLSQPEQRSIFPSHHTLVCTELITGLVSMCIGMSFTFYMDYLFNLSKGPTFFISMVTTAIVFLIIVGLLYLRRRHYTNAIYRRAAHDESHADIKVIKNYTK